jgi:hypothetical protein
VSAARRWSLRAAILFVAALCGGSAQAQATSDPAAAEALFNEAQKLANAGDYASACPKYAESLRLDSGIGVMLYLADCYERTGRSASAWAQFKEAEDLASKQADRRAATAHQRAAAIEPRLARFVLKVDPAADVAGFELKRDTTLVGRPQWGVPVPVDPGPHTITASAPGKRTREIPVRVVEGGSPTVLSITPLQDETTPGQASETVTAPPPETPPPGAEEPRASTGTQRTIAYVVGAAGLVGIAVGAAFGLDTISKNNASNSNGHCNAGSNLCDQPGVQLRKDAFTSATVSDVAFAMGAAALAGGVVLYLTAPRSSAPTVGVGTTPDGRGGGLLLRAAW